MDGRPRELGTASNSECGQEARVLARIAAPPPPIGKLGGNRISDDLYGLEIVTGQINTQDIYNHKFQQ